MSTIEVTVKPAPDGTVRLPLPPDMREGMVKITATVECIDNTASSKPSLRGFGALRGKIHLAPGFDDPLEDFRDYME